MTTLEKLAAAVLAEKYSKNLELDIYGPEEGYRDDWSIHENCHGWEGRGPSLEAALVDLLANMGAP